MYELTFFTTQKSHHQHEWMSEMSTHRSNRSCSFYLGTVVQLLRPAGTGYIFQAIRPIFRGFKDRVYFKMGRYVTYSADSGGKEAMALPVRSRQENEVWTTALIVS